MSATSSTWIPVHGAGATAGSAGAPIIVVVASAQVVSSMAWLVVTDENIEGANACDPASEQEETTSPGTEGTDGPYGS